MNLFPALVTPLLVFPLAYGIGSLPLGGRLIAWITEQRPRDLSAHNLGVENVLRLLGAKAAVASFGLDVVKGALAVVLFGGSPWAALGVYAGHLYPLRGVREALPRGRGNGVLLGILAGFWVAAAVPFWVTGLPVALYAALLAATGYVALATLGGLVTLPVLIGLYADSTMVFCTLLIFGLALWRHKASLARIIDGTEMRLGDPPPVRGVDPGVVYAAFMIHPLSLDDLWQSRSFRLLSKLLQTPRLPEPLVKRALLMMRPQKQGDIFGIQLSDGRELRVMLIGGPLLPDQIRRYPGVATRMAIQGARLARELGAEAFGLGAFWSTVGDKGLEIQAAVPDIHITNGGAYTAATVKAAVPGLLTRFRVEGGALHNACAAVVGANGVVAFGVARTIAPEVGRLILVGRDEMRLERSAETLRRKYPHAEIKTGTDSALCAEADLVFTATSDPKPVIFAENVKPGAWIFDLGRPADVDRGVLEVPGVHVIPGGVVRPPGEMRSRIDIHFGDGLVPACMAETMIMTATRSFERKSLGPQTRSTDIDYYLEQGARLGFEIVTRDERVTTVAEPA